MNKPQVSIITITLNSARFIASTVESVLNQSFRDFEYIIFDGGSADDTLNIVRSFGDSRIRVICGKDSGISNALNQALAQTSGEIVGIIHSDDMYISDAVEAAVTALNRESKGWCYGELDYIADDGSFLYRVGIPYSFEKFSRYMILNHPTMFVRKSLYSELGFFREDLRYAMDYELGLRLSRKEEPLFIPKVLARMRFGGTSSQNKGAEIKVAKEVFSIHESYFPARKFLNEWIKTWTVLKIRIRYFLNGVSGGKAVVSFLRRFVHPHWKSDRS